MPRNPTRSISAAQFAAEIIAQRVRPLLVIENGPIERELRSTSTPLFKELARSFELNPPLYITEEYDAMTRVLQDPPVILFDE